MRKGPDTEKAADQAFNQGLATRCGKDCPGRTAETNLPPCPGTMSLVSGWIRRGRDDLNSDIANTVLAITRGLR